MTSTSVTDQGTSSVSHARCIVVSLSESPCPSPSLLASPIVVVDDDEDLREIVALALESAGYRVTCAEHGRAAQRLLRLERPRLVLLDLDMPVMTGHALFDWMRESPSLYGVPVVIHSASFVAPGAFGESTVLPKPASHARLLQVVRSCARG